MASMGFVQHAAKTYEQNRKLLREKSFFREIAKPRAIRRKSKIDGNALKQKAIILAQRNLNHRLRLILAGSLIYLAFVISYAYLIKTSI